MESSGISTFLRSPIVSAGMILVGLSLFSAKAQAYPGFVAHGYTTCGSCHYNPMGNGPLTDYGRALGATLISGKPPWIDSAGKSEEQVAEITANQSGFLGPVQLPFWLRPSLNYREMLLRTGLQDKPVSRWIEMQQEVAVVLQTRDSKIIASINYGHIPVPAAAPKTDASQYRRWVSREYYLGVRTLKRVHFYAGLMDPAYGLRLSEHTSYILTRGSRNIYDQNLGLLIHVNGKKWDAYFNPVVGNPQQQSSLRRKGVIGTFEYEPFERIRFGVSGFSTSNSFQQRKMGGIFTRMGLGKNGAGLLAEVSLISDQPTAGGQDAIQQENSFIQATAVLTRGLYFLMTVENSISNFHVAQNRTIRAGPAIQWFPFQRLELRTDFLSTRSLASSPLTPDDYSLLAQIHVWL